MAVIQSDSRVRRTALRRALCGAALLLMVHQATAEDAAQTKISIDNFVFTPQRLKVKQGTTVTWVNHDDIPHSIVVAALRVHSPPLDTDGRFAFRFAAAGTYSYICGLHPFMKGEVEVSP